MKRKNRRRKQQNNQLIKKVKIMLRITINLKFKHLLNNIKKRMKVQKNRFLLLLKINIFKSFNHLLNKQSKNRKQTNLLLCKFKYHRVL